VDVELADAMVVEEDISSSAIGFDGQLLAAEIILTDAEDISIRTGPLAGKVLLINCATREVIVQHHIP
jgi:hypothetical protein